MCRDRHHMGNLCTFPSWICCEFKIALNLQCLEQRGEMALTWRTATTTMGVLNKPKSEMIPEELKKQEKEEFNPGPLSVLTPSVKNST